MALLFADSFDHYGTGNVGANRMLNDGAYSAGDVNFGPTATVPARTGPYCLRSATSSSLSLTRLIGGPHVTVGAAVAMYMTTVANNNGFFLRGSGPNIIIGVRTRVDGALAVFSGGNSIAGGTDIAVSPPGIISTGAWHHIELKATIDPTVGGFELRVNGEILIAMSNINLGSDLVTRFTLATTLIGTCFDDLVIWNDQGDAPRNFIGPARVITTYPATDTPVADFAKVGAANGYACINQPAQDGDTTYIEGINVDDASEFGIGTLPPETEGIVGVFVPTLAKLAAAGEGSMKISVMSDTDEAVGFSGPLTQAYAYRDSAFGVNPATGSPWDKASLEAARLRFEKTA